MAAPMSSLVLEQPAGRSVRRPGVPATAATMYSRVQMTWSDHSLRNASSDRLGSRLPMAPCLLCLAARRSGATAGIGRVAE